MCVSATLCTLNSFHSLPLCLSVQTEFIRGLLQVTESKLHHALLVHDKVVHDDELMPHWVDEILHCEQELRALDYPSPLPTPIAVLLEGGPFNKWTIIEKRSESTGGIPNGRGGAFGGPAGIGDVSWVYVSVM